MNKESGRLMGSKYQIMESCEGLIKNLDFILSLVGGNLRYSFLFKRSPCYVENGPTGSGPSDKKKERAITAAVQARK